MFSRDQIEQVRSRVDIVDVIRGYVPSLKVAGRSVRGLCPFHSERTPSFHVHPEKGLYKCFGCGEAGDVIGFVSKIEQVSFTEALESLADKVGVQLQRSKQQMEKQPEGIKEKLHRLLDAAAYMYEEMLWSERDGEEARAYLQTRNLTEETIRAFRLGVAPQSGGAVFEALVKKGYSIELCQQAGLATRSAAGRFYDPLYGRLIFPILDGFGHVVGFGGRILPQTKKPLLGSDEKESDAPKYINSPESPVFSKGRLLYGLYQAKTNILSSRRAMVVEGYMDVIGVHQGGFPIAVATLGTAFTRDHAKILKRYANEVLAFFDPDEAGARAAMRSLEPMIQEDLFTRVVVTEEKGDPDEIIQEKGPEFFSGLLDQAPDFVDYLLKHVGRVADSLQTKAAAAKQILDLIAQSPNEILKGEWVLRVSQALSLNAESLNKELGRVTVKEKPPAPVRTNVIESRFIPTAADECLQLLMTAAAAWSDLDLTADDFANDRHKRLFLMMKAQMDQDHKVSIPALYDEVSPEDKDWLLTLSLEGKTYTEPIDRRNQLVRDVRLGRDKSRLAQLRERVNSGNVSKQEYEDYNNLLRSVKGTRVITNDQRT
jgi:DNA primase